MKKRKVKNKDNNTYLNSRLFYKFGPFSAKGLPMVGL